MSTPTVADHLTSAVADYLATVPAERRAVFDAVRATVNANLPAGYREGVQYGALGWCVPHSLYPAGYHCDPKQPLPFMGLANNKQGISLHMFCIYCDPAAMERFVSDWRAAGKKLDMGKGCVRFKKLDDVPLDVVGRAVAAMPVDVFVRAYEAAVPASARKKRK